MSNLPHAANSSLGYASSVQTLRRPTWTPISRGSERNYLGNGERTQSALPTVMIPVL